MCILLGFWGMVQVVDFTNGVVVFFEVLVLVGKDEWRWSL